MLWRDGFTVPAFVSGLNFSIPLFLKSSIQGPEGCKYRDHKVKVKNSKDSEMYLTLMTHRLLDIMNGNIFFPFYFQGANLHKSKKKTDLLKDFLR